MKWLMTLYSLPGIQLLRGQGTSVNHLGMCACTYYLYTDNFNEFMAHKNTFDFFGQKTKYSVIM